MSVFEPPSLKQIRMFEAVARLESISAAAAEIHLSQPAVTQTIRNLERQLARPLFERRRTGSYLTADGRILLSRSKRLLTQIRQALCEPSVGSAFADAGTVASLEQKITDTHVRSLIAISASASFDEAARRLSISEPSLHRSARMLERILRRTLYRRTAQGFTTTPPATELARRLRVALREVDYGVEELEAEQGRFVSRLVIGNIPHSDFHVLSSTVNALLARFPDASVHVIDGHYDHLLTGLRAGQVDVLYGVLRLPERVTDVEERFLFPNPYAIVGRRNHPIGALAKVTVRDLSRYDWIMPPLGTPRRSAFERLFAGSDQPPNVAIETTSMDVYRTALRSSDRLALFSRREMEADMASGLEIAPFRSAHLRRRDGIAIRSNWQPTVIHTTFLELLKNCIGTR